MDKEQLLYHYFSNHLTPEQQRQIKKLLATDRGFKEQFDLEQDLQRAVRDTKRKDLRVKLADFESDIVKNAPQKDVLKETPDRSLPRYRYREWAIAASVALLVGLGWLGYHNLLVTDYAELYDDNMQQYPNTVYTITRGDTVESLERRAFVAYERGDFEAALEGFGEIPPGEQQPYMDFYRAQAYLQLGQTTEAKRLFEKNIAAGTGFTGESQWYLALAYLKEKDRASAVEHLKRLISDYGYNTEAAKVLLGELE